MIASEVMEIMAKMEAQLEVCPRCRTRQPLAQVLIQKKSLGGQFVPANLRNLCLPCDEDWRRFYEGKALQPDDSFDYYFNAWQDFLQTPVGPESLAARTMSALKELAGLRVEIATEEQRWKGRYRSRSRRLDEVFPLSESRHCARLVRQEFGSEAQDITWQKLLMSQVAAVTRFKARIEREITYLLRYFPVWDMYLEHIPGVSGWLGGYLIQAIGDPRRYPSGSHLRGDAGTRVIEDDKGITIAEPRARGKSLGYNPQFKIVVVQLLAQSLLYQKTRFPDSPYSALFDYVRRKEDRKARSANPSVCQIRGCKETDIVNLGYDKGVFLGFCCRRTLNSDRPHKFLNPGHRHRRALREVGTKFLVDLYHAWLCGILREVPEDPIRWTSEGERVFGQSPNDYINPRIAWVFARALETHASEA